MFGEIIFLEVFEIIKHTYNNKNCRSDSIRCSYPTKLGLSIASHYYH
jgi:hypothetical protein